MKKVILFVTLILISLSTHVFAVERLTHQQMLYQGSRTIVSSNDHQAAWSRLSNTSLTTVQSPLIGNAAQKWRLRIFYSVSEPTGAFTIQARLNSSTGDRPIFSFGWDNAPQRVGSREAFSNWLELTDNEQLNTFDLDLYIARASNNAHAVIEIHSVQLEIWQDDDLEALLATGPIRRPQPPVPTPSLRAPQELALEQGVSFLRAAMNGDRKAMEQLLAKQPVNMTQMTGVAPQAVQPISLPSGRTFQDYLENYNIEVISYSEIAGLFDDWEKYVVSGWQVSNKSFILIGNGVKIGGEDFMSGKPLILIMEEEAGKMVVKGILQ